VEKKLGLNYLGLIPYNEEYKEAEIVEEKKKILRKIRRRK
jgi:hypothetical protein